MSKLIPLTQGYSAVVDDADFEWLSQWKWCVSMMGRPGRKKPYAVRGAWEDGRTRIILMHRVISGAGEGEKSDHRDRDGLNNVRSNLRVCSQAQNTLNRPGNQTGRKTSKYKGVYWSKGINRWVARFQEKHVACCKDEIDAAKAYDSAAKNVSADFAWLNFPEGEVH